MTFEISLTKCQNMYDIYHDEGEELSEDATPIFF